MYFLVAQKSLKAFIHNYNYVACAFIAFIFIMAIYIIRTRNWLKVNQKKLDDEEILDSYKK